jgi:hypothetical protein
METHIPESNIGYRLLQKMGWTAGKGLGSRGQGKKDHALKKEVVILTRSQAELIQSVSS